MKLNKRITPLTILLILSVGFCAVVIADWYWTSSNYSFDISVSGWMEAIVIDPAELWATPPANPSELMLLTELADFIDESGKNVLYVAFADTNAETLRATVTATIPTGVDLTCTLERWAMNSGVLEWKEDYGVITVFDGSVIFDLIVDGTEPIGMFAHEYPTAFRLLRLEFTATIGSSPIGTYDIKNIIVTCGDDI